MAKDAQEFSSTVRSNVTWFLKEVGGVYKEMALDVYNSAKDLAQDVYLPVHDDDQRDDDQRDDDDDEYEH